MKKEELKPEKLSFNVNAYNKAVLLHKEKVEVFELIVAWISKEINIETIKLKDLYKDATTVFQREYVKKNKGLANVSLSYSKCKFLLEMDDSELNELIFILEQNPSELIFKNNKLVLNSVSTETFTRFTVSEHQNKMVRVAKELTDVLDKVSEFEHVYLGSIPKAISGFLIHNQRTNRLEFNVTRLKRVITT